MAAVLRTYDITKSSIVLRGIPLEATSLDGITIAYDGDDWAMVTDTSGSVLRSRTPQGSAQATINVLPDSPSAALLNELWTIDRGTGRGAFPFVFTDWASGSRVSAAQAFILRRPDVARASEAASEAWVIVLVNPMFTMQSIPV